MTSIVIIQEIRNVLLEVLNKWLKIFLSFYY